MTAVAAVVSIPPNSIGYLLSRITDIVPRACLDASPDLSISTFGVRLQGEKQPQKTEKWRQGMERYLISFDDGTMIIPEEDLPAVGEAARNVVREAKAAGVWVFGGGVMHQRASIVGTDGTVSDGPDPETKASSAASRSSRCPHVKRRWSGRAGSPSPAGARRRCGRSGTTRNPDRRPQAPHTFVACHAHRAGLRRHSPRGLGEPGITHGPGLRCGRQSSANTICRWSVSPMLRR